MKQITTRAWLMMAACLALASPAVAQLGFTSPDLAGGQVSLDGKTLIARQGFDLAERETTPLEASRIDPLASAEDLTWARQSQGVQGAVGTGEIKPGVRWVRELALGQGHAELSLAVLVEPANRGVEDNFPRWHLYIPVEVLRGARYEWVVGRHRTFNGQRSGRFTGDEPEGKVLGVGIRAVQFTGGQQDFLIEMNYAGPWGLYLEDAATAYKGHIIRHGAHYVLVIPSHPAGSGRWGGKGAMKVVLKPGRHDVDQLHPINATHYHWPLAATHRLQFTQGELDKGYGLGAQVRGHDDAFTRADTAPWSAQSQAGWVGAGDLKVRHHERSAALPPLWRSGVEGQGEATYRLGHGNGWALVNVLLSGAGGATDLSLRTNDGPWLRAAVSADRRRTATLVTRIRDGVIDLQLKGDRWMVSGVIVQPLLFEHEDYLFERSWWAFGQEPWKADDFAHADRWTLWPDGAFGPFALPLRAILSAESH